MSKRRVAKYMEDEESDSLITFKRDIKLTPRQGAFASLIINNKITIATGPAGTAKTFVACWAALKLVASNADPYDKIIITKPTEIVGGSNLGYLPGSLDEKLAVYMESFNDAFEDIIEGQSLRQMVEAQEIVYKPIQFIRGRTFKNVVVIVDEFQSYDIRDLMDLVTRMGKNNCKMIFIGDIKQNDINKRYVAVNVFKELISGLPKTAQFEFTKEDNMRDELVSMIVERYEKMEAEGKLTPTKRNV